MIAKATHKDIAPSWSAVKHRTCTALFSQGCTEDPERPAIIIEGDIVVTRRVLLERCEHFAAFLQQHLNPGDRVAVMLDNRVKFRSSSGCERIARVSRSFLPWRVRSRTALPDTNPPTNALRLAMHHPSVRISCPCFIHPARRVRRKVACWTMVGGFASSIWINCCFRAAGKIANSVACRSTMRTPQFN